MSSVIVSTYQLIVFEPAQRVLLVKSPLGGFILPTVQISSSDDVIEKCTRLLSDLLKVDSLAAVFFLFASRVDPLTKLAEIKLVVSIDSGPTSSVECIWVASGELNKYGIEAEVQNANIYLTYEKDLARLSQIPEALEKSVSFIEANVQRIGNNVGWDHNIDIHPRIGIIGSSCGILALAYSNDRINYRLIEEVADTLLRSRHPEGGWGTKSLQEGGLPSVQSTALAIEALQILNRSVDEKAINEGLSWLNKSSKNGGWGNDKFSNEPLVTPTTFTLLSSVSAGRESLRDQAILWLKKAQHPSGAWGTYAYRALLGDKATAAHTSRAIHALIQAGISRTDPAIVQGVAWLLENQNHDGVWESTSEEEFVGKNLTGRLVFKHAGHQRAIIGLLKAGVPLSDARILRGVSHLLDIQDANGGWPHDFAPGHFPMWAALDSIIALNTIQSQFPSIIGMQTLKNQKTTLELLSVLPTLGEKPEALPVLTEATHIAETSINKQSDMIEPTTDSGLLRTGIFFSLLIIILIVVTALVIRDLNPWTLPIILIFVLIAFSLVAIVVLRQTNRITSENFSNLLKSVLKTMHLLSRGDPKGTSTAKKDRGKDR